MPTIIADVDLNPLRRKDTDHEDRIEYLEMLNLLPRRKSGAAGKVRDIILYAEDLPDHSHLSATTGGHYPWADITGFAVPTVSLGTAHAAGTATTVLRTDATFAAFDATVPTTQAVGDSAATGSAAVAARRDHVHGMPAFGTATNIADVTLTENAGASALLPRADHVHALSQAIGPVWTGHHTWQPTVDSENACTIFTSDGTGTVFVADTVHNRVGIGSSYPLSPLNVWSSTQIPQVMIGYVPDSALSIGVNSSGTVTLTADGDLVLDPEGFYVLPETAYTVNLGTLSNKYLTLHAAELWVETLVAQSTLATIGGRILVGPTSILTLNCDSSASTITVKHNSFASGDILLLEADGKIEWMVLTSGPSTVDDGYIYDVSRNLDSTGANDWYAGDAVFNTGTTGDGFIDLYSVAGVYSGYGPTIVGNVRTGTVYSNIAARWAIGNLHGVYGYGATTYGFAAGDHTTTWISADATNGFRINNGSTVLAQWFTTGALIIGQEAASQNNVYIASGALSLRTNTTERIKLTAAGVLTINDSSGAAVFTFNASTGAEFTLPLTLATTGGIFQGKGTFASPDTGLKIWAVTSGPYTYGRIGGYNSTTLQWYADTDGRLYAGGGSVVIDATNAITLKADSDWDFDNAVNFTNAAGTWFGRLNGMWVTVGGGAGAVKLEADTSDASADATATLRAEVAGAYTAASGITAYDGTTLRSAYIYCGGGNDGEFLLSNLTVNLGSDVRLSRSAANTLKLHSGDNFYLESGAIGVKTSPVSYYGIGILNEQSNQSNTRGISLVNNHTSSGGTYYGSGIVVTANEEVNVGTTNSGYMYGLNIGAWRNNAGSGTNDSGTLGELIGAIIRAGNYNDASGETPITTKVAGIEIATYCSTGSITNLYQIYLNAHSGTAPSGSRYGIFQAGASEGNYFAGRVGIGVGPGTPKLKVSGSVGVGGDDGGTASYVTFTNVTASVSSGVGTVKMNQANNRNSTGWLKFYSGATAYYVPFWQTIT